MEAAEKEAQGLQAKVEQQKLSEKAQLRQQKGPRVGRPAKSAEVKAAEEAAKIAEENAHQKRQRLANIERPTSQPASKRSRSINYKQLLDGSDEDERSADVSSEYVGSDDEEEEPCMKSKVRLSFFGVLCLNRVRFQNPGAL